MYSDDNEIQTKYVQVVSYKDKLITTTKNWIKINFSDIRLGDEIIIYFWPDSQQYIYTLHPKFGQVVKIEPDIQSSNNFYSKQTLERLTLKYNETENNASHPNCSSDYGNSCGYGFEIYRLDDIIYKSNSEQNLELNLEPNLEHENNELELEYESEYDSGYDSFG
jgi:hypothetical protein